MVSGPMRVHSPHQVGLAILVVLAGACGERPAECSDELAGTLEALAKESAGALAPRAVEQAKTEVERATAHLREQGQRWRAFQRWDAALCRAGGDALARARSDVARARAARDQVADVEAAAGAKLAASQRQLESLAAFVDGGVVGPSIAERVGRARGGLASVHSKLTLTLGELRGAGFVAPLEPLRAVAAEVEAATRTVAALSADATASALSACRPRLGAAAPSFPAAPRVLDDWMVWRGSVGERPSLFVFRLDRARRSCRQVAARLDDGALALERDDEVRVWRASGRLPSALLLGWNAAGAWFVPPGGGVFAFGHDRAARFVAPCHGKVSCDKPEVGASTVEATCTCAYGDLDLAIGDRSRRVRYVWDGRAVRAEP